MKGKEKAISLDGEFISNFLHIVDNSHFTPLSLFAFVYLAFFSKGGVGGFLSGPCSTGEARRRPFLFRRHAHQKHP